VFEKGAQLFVVAAASVHQRKMKRKEMKRRKEMLEDERVKG
jgi:hypothetical protein